MQSQNLKILIVEDEPPIANEVRFIVEDEGHEVLKIAYDSEKALDFLYRQQVDLVFLDIAINGQKNGIEIGEIINQNYSTPFIFLTSFADSDTINQAKATKPCAYIVKPFKPADILAAINIGISNWEQRSGKQQLMSLKALNQLAMDEITTREYDIILDIADGLSNVQIAKKNELTSNTIKWYIQRIYSKLDIKNRTSLVKKVFK